MDEQVEEVDAAAADLAPSFSASRSAFIRTFCALSSLPLSRSSTPTCFACTSSAGASRSFRFSRAFRSFGFSMLPMRKVTAGTCMKTRISSTWFPSATRLMRDEFMNANFLTRCFTNSSGEPFARLPSLARELRRGLEDPGVERGWPASAWPTRHLEASGWSGRAPRRARCWDVCMRARLGRAHRCRSSAGCGSDRHRSPAAIAGGVGAAAARGGASPPAGCRRAAAAAVAARGRCCCCRRWLPRRPRPAASRLQAPSALGVLVAATRATGCAAAGAAAAVPPPPPRPGWACRRQNRACALQRRQRHVGRLGTQSASASRRTGPRRQRRRDAQTAASGASPAPAAIALRATASQWRRPSTWPCMRSAVATTAPHTPQRRSPGAARVRRAARAPRPRARRPNARWRLIVVAAAPPRGRAAGTRERRARTLRRRRRRVAPPPRRASSRPPRVGRRALAAPRARGGARRGAASRATRRARRRAPRTAPWPRAAHVRLTSARAPSHEPSGTRTVCSASASASSARARRSASPTPSVASGGPGKKDVHALQLLASTRGRAAARRVARGAVDDELAAAEEGGEPASTTSTVVAASPGWTTIAQRRRGGGASAGGTSAHMHRRRSPSSIGSDRSARRRTRSARSRARYREQVDLAAVAAVAAAVDGLIKHRVDARGRRRPARAAGARRAARARRARVEAALDEALLDRLAADDNLEGAQVGGQRVGVDEPLGGRAGDPARPFGGAPHRLRRRKVLEEEDAAGPQRGGARARRRCVARRAAARRRRRGSRPSSRRRRPARSPRGRPRRCQCARRAPPPGATPWRGRRASGRRRCTRGRASPGGRRGGPGLRRARAPLSGRPAGDRAAARAATKALASLPYAQPRRYRSS